MKQAMYNPMYERLVDKARDLLGYELEEFITFDSLKTKIPEKFNNVIIETVEERGTSYITYDNEKFTFVIKTKDSYYGEAFDLALFLFYYMLHSKRTDIKKVTRHEIEENNSAFYLAHAFLISEKMYAKAFYKVANSNNSRVNIEKLQENLFGINKRVVYTRSKHLKFY